MDHRQRALTAVSSLILVALVCACSGQPASTATSSPLPTVTIGAVPTGITDPSQIHRPIDAYLLSADQVIAVERAKIRAAQDCMRAAGYPDTTVTADDDLAASIQGGVQQRTTDSDLYSFFATEATARAQGYLTPGQAGSYEVSWSTSVPQKVSDGCWTKAADATAAGVPDSSLLTTTKGLPDGGPPVPSGDPTYTRAVKDWSTCMATRGYTYTDPEQAIGDSRWHADRQKDVPSAAEIATAVADVQCKESTNLIGVAVAVQAAYDQQYIATHTNQLDRYRTALLAAVGNS